MKNLKKMRNAPFYRCANTEGERTGIRETFVH